MKASLFAILQRERWIRNMSLFSNRPRGLSITDDIFWIILIAFLSSSVIFEMYYVFTRVWTCWAACWLILTCPIGSGCKFCIKQGGSSSPIVQMSTAMYLMVLGFWCQAIVPSGKVAPIIGSNPRLYLINSIALFMTESPFHVAGSNVSLTATVDIMLAPATARHLD